MEKILTLEEIEERYDSELVLLDSPQIDENLEVLSGRIAWHSKDRDEVDRKAVEMRLQSSAFLYTGEKELDYDQRRGPCEDRGAGSATDAGRAGGVV